MKYEKGLIFRILIAIILAVFFHIYYIVFSPVTISLVSFFLRVFGYSVLIDFIGKGIVVNGVSLSFIDACVAGSAYFLFSLLVLFTKDLGLRRSLNMILYGFLMILGMNVLRVVILIIVLLRLGQNWFDLIHMTFWWFVAGIYVALVWIFLVNKFKVKTIPVYSDIKYLISSLKK